MILENYYELLSGNYAQTVQCNTSGGYDYMGTGTGTGPNDFTYSAAPQICKAISTSSERLFSWSQGNINIQSTVPNRNLYAITSKGTVTTDSKISGECSVDYRKSVSASGQIFSGTVCGFSVEGW